jgi:hypothetical protein
MWQAEAERTQNRLDDLQPGDSAGAISEGAIEQGWYDYCFRKHERVAWEERVRLTSPATGIAKEDFHLTKREAQSKRLNLPISNVPGPRERGRLGGAMISEIYSVGPLIAGSGINITVWSYVDQLNISVLADDITLDGPHVATDAIVHAFTEIRSAAGFSGNLTEVLTAMAPATAAG